MNAQLRSVETLMPQEILGLQRSGDILLIDVREPAEFAAERIPGAALHIVPDASHMAPLDKPSQVNEILLGFLAPH